MIAKELHRLAVSIEALARAISRQPQFSNGALPNTIAELAEHAFDSVPHACRPCPQTEWSRAGGKEELPVVAQIFSTAAYRQLFRSNVAREVYVGACPGLARLSAAAILKVRNFKFLGLNEAAIAAGWRAVLAG